MRQPPTMRKLLFRPARAEDAPRVQRTCWPEQPLGKVVTLLQRAEKLRKKRRGLGVVAVRDGVVYGFGMLTLWPRAAEISDLVVSARYRGQGVGTAIIQFLTEAAQDLNATIVEIGVALSNTRALALYRRLGFRDYRTIQVDLGQGPEPVLYLEKAFSSQQGQS